jgi:hypothetical protein
MATLIDDAAIFYALLDLKSGSPLSLTESGSARVEDIASAAPELFRAGAPADFSALFSRLSGETVSAWAQEIVLMSAGAAHVVQRGARRPDLALVAVSEDTRKLGLMLSGVRTRMLELEVAWQAEVEP